MELNLLHIMWISYSLIVTLSGLNVLYVKNVPYIFVRLFTFGKLNKSIKHQKTIVEWLEIPKKWFAHFYVFASFYLSFITVTVLQRYFISYASPYVIYLLDLFGSINRQSFVKPESTIILSILVTLQVLRRCYECLYISVYSDSKMNLSHYIVGFTFYFGVGLSLVHDAPGFESGIYAERKIHLVNQWFTSAHCIGTVLFLTAFLLQFETHKAFAALRKSGDKIVSNEHYMPSSGFFEYVSCPHYFAEIVMYLSGSIILGGQSFTWWLVCLWTVTNQVLTALMSHQWYRKTFKKYPKDRKAIIPFLL